MNKKISIIVPVFKSEKWLDRCLESIKNQIYTNLEIIVINDGSPDNSGEICDKYAAIDSRFKVIHKKNAGTSAARNDGLKVATGGYVQFVDSDDWIEKNMCKLLVENIEKSGSDLVVCGLIVNKNNVEIRRPYLPYKKLRVKENIENFFYLRKIFSSPCNKLYKKEFIKHLFNENSSLGEDLMFNLDYLKNIETTLVIEDCLYNVCLDNNESLNRSFREDRLDIVIGLVNKELEFCKSLYGELADKTEIYNSYILGVHSYFRDIIFTKYKTKHEFYKIVSKYSNDPIIQNAVKQSNLKRFDYKLFNSLVMLRSKELLYVFFKIKTLRKIIS